MPRSSPNQPAYAKAAITLAIAALAISVVQYLWNERRRDTDYFQQASQIIQLAAQTQQDTVLGKIEAALRELALPNLQLIDFQPQSGGSSVSGEEASRDAEVAFTFNRPLSPEEHAKIAKRIQGSAVRLDGQNLNGSTGVWSSSFSVKPFDARNDDLRSLITIEYAFACTKR